MIKHLNRIVLASVCVAAVAAFSAGANASMVTNGDFDGTIVNTDFQTVNSVSTTIPGWTVSSGNVDWINGYWLGSSLTSGDHSVDLSGSNTQGTIEQLISGLVNGQWYKLTFDTALNPDEIPGPAISQSLVWTLGLQGGVAVGTTNPNTSWTSFAFSFLWGGGNTAALLFASTVPGANNCCYGPALDNVELNAVPLPAALPLFAAGLGVMGYMGSRRRRKAAIAA